MKRKFLLFLLKWLFATVLFVVFGLMDAFIFEVLAQTNKPNTSFSRGAEEPPNLLKPDPVKRKSVLPFAPLQPANDAWKVFDDALIEKINLNLGISLTTAYTKMSESLPDTEDNGFGYDVGFFGEWSLLKVGSKWEGFLSFLVQGRDSLFTEDSPGDLFLNAGSLAGPVDSFDNDQGFVVREMWWQQGSKDAHLIYRVGKIAPDTIVGTISQFDSANLDFMALGQVVKLSARFADAGLGAAVGFYPQGNSRLRPHIHLYASDQNGDRSTFGDIDEGEFFTGVEAGFRPFPQTDKAPFWRFSVWHADEQDKEGIAEGYGVLAKIEQELSSDGSVIGVLNYGHSWEGAPAKNQVTARLVIFEPFPRKVDLAGDRLGFAASWIDPAVPGARDEYNLEAYYRFPLFPNLDVTLDFQYMIDPAFIPIVESVAPDTDTFDDIFVFSVRFRTVF